MQDNNLKQSAPGPEAVYLQALTNYWLVLTMRSVAELGIADHLKDGPATVGVLAEKTRSDSAALYRVLRAMASAGFFTEMPGPAFALTPVGQLLRSDLPNSFRWMILAEFEMSRVPAWHALGQSIRTGCIAFDHAHGKDCWQHYRENPQQGENFARWMTQNSHVTSQAILSAFDFSPFATIVDIGGGQGSFIEAIVGQAPSCRGVLFDQPEIIATAPDRPRVTSTAGNFFESVPAGGDLYTMKWIIHDWSEPKAITILRNIRHSMKPGAKLMLIEILISEGPGPDFGKWMDINMLAMTGGRERTAAEYRELLAAAGFGVERIVPAGLPSLIVASPNN